MINLYPIPTKKHFINIENKLKSHFEYRENLSAQAKLLEKLLQELKSASIDNDPIWSKVKQLVNNYLGTSGDTLFKKGKDGDLANWQIGREFEHEMVALLDTLWDIYLGQPGKTKATYSTSKKGHKTITRPMYTGGIKGNISMTTNFDVDSMLNDWSVAEKISGKRLNPNLNKILKKNRYGQWVEAPTFRDVKTDMYGGTSRSYISVDWNSGSKLVQLLALLNNYKISLKSYKDLTAVHLGSTKPFKAYAGVLKTLDYSDHDILYSYLRAKCCYICTVQITQKKEAHKVHQKKVIDVMHQIKSVYELIGMGLLSENGKFKDNVQLIIINQYSSDKTIKVFDTTTLIQELLNGKGSKFGVNVNRKVLEINPFKAESISINVK